MGLKRGERVVVESELGVSIGRVVLEDEMRKDTGKELKPVLRRVTEDDLKKEEDNRSLKKEAFDFCNERIMARGLAMKLLGTDVTLDRKRIVFFFSAETRIDFRELVKDLAAKFRTRIELRQVGVRDAARITGGLGVCGRELCCRRFLTSFLPISIKMAKKQDLALNTSKLSGICGRLMCCLGYEYEEKARELKKKKREERPEEKKAEKEEAREATVVETPPEAPKPPEAAPRTEAAPVGEGEAPAKKRRRRRKHRPRRRPGEEGQRGQEQRPAPKEQPAKAKAPEAGAAEAKPSGEKPSGEKPAEGAPSGKKPFRRKRRRRMKGKSSRPAHEKKE
jgi:cell fate regulator YaaT (PSP1 superfamily)